MISFIEMSMTMTVIVMIIWQSWFDDDGGGNGKKIKPHIAHPESCEGGFVNDDNDNDDANDDWQ